LEGRADLDSPQIKSCGRLYIQQGVKREPTWFIFSLTPATKCGSPNRGQIVQNHCFFVYIDIKNYLNSKTNTMKKVILGSILMIALSISFVSCRETKDKAKDAMEETNEALKEVGEDMKKVGEEAKDAASEVMDDAKEMGKDMKEAGAEALDKAGNTAKEVGNDVKDAATKAAEKTKAAAKAAKEKIEE
jgi:gas vesicle protein